MSFEFGSVLTGEYLALMLRGAMMSLMLFVVAWVAALVLGLILLALRESGKRPLEWFVQGYVEYHRNVPLLVQLFIWYFGISQLLPFSWQVWLNQRSAEFLFAFIALSLNTAAYMSEDLRSGLRAVSKDQFEASRALGLSYGQAMKDVLMPQAIRLSISPLVSQTLNLFKATSLGMAIGVAEMTYASRRVENETFQTFEIFAVATIFYLAISFSIMGLGGRLSARWGKLS